MVIKLDIDTSKFENVPWHRDMFTAQLNKLIKIATTGSDDLYAEIQKQKERSTETTPETPVVKEAPAKPAAATPSKVKTRTYKPKKCVDCGETFQPATGRAERCPECRRQHHINEVREQRKRQKKRRQEASAAKRAAEAETVKAAPAKPEPPKIVRCRKCHKPYLPTADDKNGYCQKCIDKLNNAPKLKPLGELFTVDEVLAMPVAQRYRYAYQWSYAQRQQALAKKPLGALSPEEHEFYRRCETGDFMED